MNKSRSELTAKFSFSNLNKNALDCLLKMKLALISFLLLLVPLGESWINHFCPLEIPKTNFSSNYLASANPISSLVNAGPSVKLLFHDNFVITEGYDARDIRYHFDSNNDFQFESRDNRSDWPNFMQLQGDLNASAGFAIESFTRGPDWDSKPVTCKNNSTKQLQHFIYHCFGNLILRELSMAEKTQIQQYKAEQQGIYLVDQTNRQKFSNLFFPNSDQEAFHFDLQSKANDYQIGQNQLSTFWGSNWEYPPWASCFCPIQ